MSGLRNFILVLLVLCAVSFSANTSALTNASMMCTQNGVISVSLCNGNIIRVNSSISGANLIFYASNGSVVADCSSSSSAQCSQMIRNPNFCPTLVCTPSSPPPATENQSTQTQPTMNASMNQSIQNQTQITPPPQPQVQNSTQASTAPIVPVQNTTVNSAPVPTPAPIEVAAEAPVDNLLYVVLGLGIISIVVLFLLFRNTLKE